MPSTAKPPSARSQLTGFIDKYTPAIAREGRAVLAALRKRMPGAVELIYDNYNWLVVGFGPSNRASEAILSVVFTPRWITVCFLQNGPKLSDPHKLLRGSGKRVRSIRLESAADLRKPAIRALIDQAIDKAAIQIDPTVRTRLEVRAIVAKQRPRRPVAR